MRKDPTRRLKRALSSSCNSSSGDLRELGRADPAALARRVGVVRGRAEAGRGALANSRPRGHYCSGFVEDLPEEGRTSQRVPKYVVLAVRNSYGNGLDAPDRLHEKTKHSFKRDRYQEINVSASALRDLRVGELALPRLSLHVRAYLQSAESA